MRISRSGRLACAWLVTIAVAACSAERTDDAASRTAPSTSPTVTTPAASTPVSTPVSTETKTAAPAAATSAAASPAGAWPRGLVCGIQAGEVTVLGDPVHWRIIALRGGTLTLTEMNRDVARTASDLLAAGYTEVAGTKSPAFDRALGERELRVTLGSSGKAKVDTKCKAPESGYTTAEIEQAGWITAYVHRRIGRGRVSSIQVSDGDEHYARARFSTVEARPDTTGLVDAGDGAFRNAPGAEPESVVILKDEPLFVEFRTGSALLVDNGIEMHKAGRER